MNTSLAITLSQENHSRNYKHFHLHFDGLHGPLQWFMDIVTKSIQNKMSIVKINLFFKTDCHQNLPIIRFITLSYRQKKRRWTNFKNAKCDRIFHLGLLIMWGLSSTKRVKDFLISSCDFQQCLRYNDITIFLEILDCSSRIL